MKGIKNITVFKIGSKVKFLRQCVGHKTQYLTGTIIRFDSDKKTEEYDIEFYRNKMHESPIAGIKAKCEYGSALEWNHEMRLCELKLIK